jgi:hypothetical protein
LYRRLLAPKTRQVVARDDVDLQIFVGKQEVTVTERRQLRPSMGIHVSITRLSRGVHYRFPLPIIYVGLAGSLSALWCLDGCLVREPSQTQGCSDHQRKLVADFAVAVRIAACGVHAVISVGQPVLP